MKILSLFIYYLCYCTSLLDLSDVLNLSFGHDALLLITECLAAYDACALFYQPDIAKRKKVYLKECLCYL